jgi:hypothetical protein
MVVWAYIYVWLFGQQDNASFPECNQFWKKKHQAIEEINASQVDVCV